ncbi:MAG: hypothetical protein OXC07_02955 [Kistimonas sp.]|nr:hypothetical protein [Kistimonas sp.]
MSRRAASLSSVAEIRLMAAQALLVIYAGRDSLATEDQQTHSCLCPERLERSSSEREAACNCLLQLRPAGDAVSRWKCLVNNATGYPGDNRAMEAWLRVRGYPLRCGAMTVACCHETISPALVHGRITGVARSGQGSVASQRARTRVP